MDIRKILSNNIVYYRIKNNWTQEHLAEEMKTSAAYISEIENGKRNISIDQIENISNIFSIEPHLLFIDREIVKVRRIKKRKNKS